MLEAFLKLAIDPADGEALRREVASQVQSVRASAGRGAGSLVETVETAVWADPKAAFTFDDSGRTTLTGAGNTWHAGRFEIPSIGELRERARAAGQGAAGGRLRLWVLDGRSPVTDIGALQATASAGSLFQVASQFNCLESPGPYVAAVEDYFHDLTQGPRASISAFPATLLRHYAAPGPGGERFVQRSGGPGIDLLAGAFEPGKSPVRNGYLLDHGGMGPEALAAALQAGFDRIRVGLHDEVQVVLGYDFHGSVDGERRIAQLFTSTLAGGMYSGRNFDAWFEPICRQTLRAAYLGTLLSAVALRKRLAVLTLIGGGVFGNPAALIWESILWAMDEVRPIVAGELDVVLNGYSLSRQVDLAQILPAVRERGGAILRLDSDGLVEVLR
jgi:hypothetical protein